jgi:peroxin-11C
MDVAVKILQSYSGRDKILRTTSYLCTFLSNTLKGKIATDLATFGKAVSASRTVGRLFDDLIALSGTRAYGWGTHVSYR